MNSDKFVRLILAMQEQQESGKNIDKELRNLCSYFVSKNVVKEKKSDKINN